MKIIAIARYLGRYNFGRTNNLLSFLAVNFPMQDCPLDLKTLETAILNFGYLPIIDSYLFAAILINLTLQ